MRRRYSTANRSATLSAMKKSARKEAPTPDSFLKTAGLRRTPVRLGVIRVLSGTGGAMEVPQILQGLPEHTDAVTVYRTLNTFIRRKLVHRVRGQGRSWQYAIGPSDKKSVHQHPHFVCDDCGSVDCLSESVVPSGLVKSLKVAPGYAVSYPEIVLHGKCPKCD
jgi:Fur family ferric uptake transcriptional regulator